ncbi:AMP-binding protein [Streptomyces sp. NPDC004822]
MYPAREGQAPAPEPARRPALRSARARRTPNRAALLQDDRALTFGALCERAERLAAGLYGLGVRPGTVVVRPRKLPERLEVVDALPRDETPRKVLEYRLRERFPDTSASGPGAHSGTVK